jgi:hypothetical protein
MCVIFHLHSAEKVHQNDDMSHSISYGHAPSLGSKKRVTLNKRSCIETDQYCPTTRKSTKKVRFSGVFNRTIEENRGYWRGSLAKTTTRGPVGSSRGPLRYSSSSRLRGDERSSLMRGNCIRFVSGSGSTTGADWAISTTGVDSAAGTGGIASGAVGCCATGDG